MQRVGGLLHSWLRPQFLDSAFLQRAVTRWAASRVTRAWHPDRPSLLSCWLLPRFQRHASVAPVSAWQCPFPHMHARFHVAAL